MIDKYKKNINKVIKIAIVCGLVCGIDCVNFLKIS